MKNRLKNFAAFLLVIVMMAAMLAPAGSAEENPQRLDAYYTLAINYIAREDYTKAMEYLKACYNYCDEESNPVMVADLHLKEGCVYTMTGDYENALKELDEAIRINPELSDAYLVKTQALSDLGRTEEAIECLKKYIELSGDTSMEETLSQLYVNSGDAANAVAAYDDYLTGSELTEVEKSFQSGVYKMSLGLYEDAVSDFAACSEDPDYAMASRYNTGLCYMYLEDYASALENFNACKEADYEMDGLAYNRAVCSMSIGQYEDAIEAFNESIETESYKTDAMYNCAVCNMVMGQHQEAIDKFTAYIEAVEENAEEGENVTDVATYYRGVSYLSNSEFDKAASDFDACVEAGVMVADSTFNRALSYLQGGKYEEALADFTACIDAGNNASEALFYRSYAYRYLGQNEEALQDLTACIDQGYNLSQAYYQRAQVYNEMNDQDHYLEDLEASLAY